jgi:uncharacterized tellurite resistance protein B-like protein
MIGVRPITRTVGRGQFFCPECAARRPYLRQRVQRRFTLFFVSVIPLDELGEYVECGHCHGTFRTTILDAAAAQERFSAEFRPAVLRIMLLMMMEDGRVERSEQAMILDVNRKITGQVLPLDVIDEHLAAVRRGPGSAEDYARQIAPLLNEMGKEMVLKAAFAIAVADRQVHELERRLLHRIGRALDMSAGHIRAVLAESVAAAARDLGTGRDPGFLDDPGPTRVH